MLQLARKLLQNNLPYGELCSSNSCNDIAMISKNVQVVHSWLYLHLARLVSKISGLGNHAHHVPC